MMAPPRRLALVSEDGATQATLASYLRETGFEVHECAELALPTSFAALVLISQSETSSDAILAHIRSWLRLTRTQRVVVVTPKPAALKDLVLAHGDRLIVLPAPVFGWEVVDALRATEPRRPRGA